MKKDFYVSPSVRVRTINYEYSLLTSGSEVSSSSTLEGFEDNGESIVW
ncbi:MAG: hypothetical protein IK045_01215 [Bacteroidales bacterium]|nr:hypothetical protein [Bacteroidales bacterium]